LHFGQQRLVRKLHAAAEGIAEELLAELADEGVLPRGQQIFTQAGEPFELDAVHGFHAHINGPVAEVLLAEAADGIKAFQREPEGVDPLVADRAFFVIRVLLDKLPAFKARYEWLMMNRPDLSLGIMCIWTPDGARCLLSIANFDRLQRILQRTLDETEFLSDFGVRSVSKYHEQHPYEFSVDGTVLTIKYTLLSIL